MKHVINYTTPITHDIIKDFTISDAESYPCIDFEKMGNKTEWTQIWLNPDVYDKYKSENKIYNIHYYNMDIGLKSYYNLLTHNIDSMIKELIFIYVESDKDNPYHAIIVNNYDKVHGMDITSALKQHYAYWYVMYIPSKNIRDMYKNDNNYILCNTNLSYFYDTDKEAKNGLIDYAVNLIRNSIAPVQVEYHSLTTDYTYERMFNKIFDERCKNLKKEIEEELQRRKEAVTAELEDYNKYLSKFTELLQQ